MLRRDGLVAGAGRRLHWRPRPVRRCRRWTRHCPRRPRRSPPASPRRRRVAWGTNEATSDHASSMPWLHSTASSMRSSSHRLQSMDWSTIGPRVLRETLSARSRHARIGEPKDLRVVVRRPRGTPVRRWPGLLGRRSASCGSRNGRRCADCWLTGCARGRWGRRPWFRRPWRSARPDP